MWQSPCGFCGREGATAGWASTWLRNRSRHRFPLLGLVVDIPALSAFMMSAMHCQARTPCSRTSLPGTTMRYFVFSGAYAYAIRLQHVGEQRRQEAEQGYMCPSIDWAASSSYMAGTHWRSLSSSSGVKFALLCVFDVFSASRWCPELAGLSISMSDGCR